MNPIATFDKPVRPNTYLEPVLKSMKKLLIAASLWCLHQGVSAQTYSIAQRERVNKVVIDAGHGGHDAGCMHHGHIEKHINLSVALQLGALIQQRYPHIEVIYTRIVDVFVPLEERAAIANHAQADLFLSVHCNYLYSRRGRHHASGTETFYFNSDNHADEWLAQRNDSTLDSLRKLPIPSHRAEKSRKMAMLIENAMQQVTKRHSRGIKVDALRVLYLTKMPSVLSEIGFLSDYQEGQYLSRAEGQTEVTQALFQAFEAYIDPNPPARPTSAVVEVLPLRQLPAEIASLERS